MINFLGELFKDKKSYSCINAYKCAISQTLASCGNTQFIENSIVVRFMKGVFNIRPPLPRYQFTWDVSKVLKFLQTLFPLHSLDLKSVTLKLAALLALSSAQRAQTLVNLRIDSMSIEDKHVSFSVRTLMKTSKINNVVYRVKIDKFEQKELCPVYTLKFYLDKTKECRKCKNLLISFRTFNKITTSTLARWLKSVLSLSGIDSSKFKAHSYRGAATSAAFMSGVTLNDIMKTANWQSARTFKKFYLRDKIQDAPETNFAEKVFSSHVSV